jgi:enamine deaminase RidA (YjgF/YER057c/UK114 family)
VKRLSGLRQRAIVRTALQPGRSAVIMPPVPATTPEERLAQLGIELPAPPAAVARFVNVVRVGSLLFTAGHAPMREGTFAYTGKLGAGVDVETGKLAAALAAANMVASVRAEVGELSRISRVVRLLVMVNSAPDFIEQPLVANGASDLMVEAFGPEVGTHARSAVGMAALPFDISVEVEGVFALGAGS